MKTPQKILTEGEMREIAQEYADMTFLIACHFKRLKAKRREKQMERV